MRNPNMKLFRQKQNERRVTQAVGSEVLDQLVYEN